MASLPTAQDLATFVDNTLRSLIDPNGTGAYDNSPGSDNAVLTSLLAKVGARILAYASDRKAATLPGSSSGPDLAAIIQDVFFDGIQDATAAVGTVYLRRTGSMPLTFISQGDRFSTQATGGVSAIEFASDGTIPVPAGQSYVAVPVTCLQTGSIGEVDLASITQIEDQLDDQSWQLYVPITGDPVLAGALAPSSVGGGQDQESDTQAKARVFARPAQAQPGTKAGVYKGTTTVAGIASAVPVEPGDGTGIVYAGDQNFLLPDALKRALATQLESWRAFGVPVAARAFSVTTVQVTATVYMQQDLSNYDQDKLLANAVSAVLAYFATGRSRPDEYFVDQIRGAIGSGNAGTQTVVLSSPATDQKRPSDGSYGALAAMNRYRVTAASISITFAGPQTQ